MRTIIPCRIDILHNCKTLDYDIALGFKKKTHKGQGCRRDHSWGYHVRSDDMCSLALWWKEPEVALAPYLDWLQSVMIRLFHAARINKDNKRSESSA